MPEDFSQQIDSITDPANTSVTNQGGAQNAEFMQEVQNRLLNQADVVSSADTNLEQSFAEAQRGVRESQQASEQRIESQFGRERRYQEGEAQSQFTSFGESRSGFGTQMAAFRRLVETTDKELKDLDQRKQELILQGESDAAQQIANLQVQQLQFRQQAEQNVFSNLLGLGEFAQQQQSQNLAERKFGLQQQQTRLQGVQLAMQGSNDAFSRIGSLQEMGALSGLPEDQRVDLERRAGLPRGTVDAIANAPADREIRAVGNTLLAINPKTLETSVLYNQPESGGGGGVNLGSGTEVSFLTSSVMNGMQRIQDLTPTQQAEVRAEMSQAGFASKEAPQWFRERLNEESQQSVRDTVVQSEWQSYRESFVHGPRFINEDYFHSVYSQEELETDAENWGYDNPNSYINAFLLRVEDLRNKGLNDMEIKDLLNIEK